MSFAVSCPPGSYQIYLRFKEWWMMMDMFCNKLQLNVLAVQLATIKINKAKLLVRNVQWAIQLLLLLH